MIVTVQITAAYVCGELLAAQRSLHILSDWERSNRGKETATPRLLKLLGEQRRDRRETCDMAASYLRHYPAANDSQMAPEAA